MDIVNHCNERKVESASADLVDPFVNSLVHTWQILIIYCTVSTGYFCVNGSRTLTPTDGVTGDLCKPGQYCPEGSSEGIGCPAGKNC